MEAMAQLSCTRRQEGVLHRCLHAWSRCARSNTLERRAWATWWHRRLSHVLWAWRSATQRGRYLRSVTRRLARARLMGIVQVRSDVIVIGMSLRPRL